MRTFLFILLFSLSATSSVAQHTLTIEFKGIQEREGKVMLALRDANGNDIEKVIVDIPANGKITYTFEGLEAGTYTAACYHDENENQKLDKNMVGYPTEIFGFSNDARGTFGPPELSDQAFEVSGDTRITITLQ